LDHLVDGEFPGQCPSCKEFIYVVVGQYGFFIANEDWVRNAAAKRMPITRVTPSELDGIPRWLQQSAGQVGQQELADWFEYLVGTATCPRCGTEINARDAILGE